MQDTQGEEMCVCVGKVCVCVTGAPPLSLWPLRCVLLPDRAAGETASVCVCVWKVFVAVTVHVSHRETSQDSHMPQALTHCTTVLRLPPCVRLAGRRVEDEREKRLPWVPRVS